MSRDLGEQFEDLIAEELGLRKTTNSGAKYDNADLASRRVMIEAKVKNDLKGLGGCNSELKKLKKQAEKLLKDWIYIQRNQGGIFVVMDWNYFLEFWEKTRDGKNVPS